MWWNILLGAVGGLLLLWLALVGVLWVVRPESTSAREQMRLLPDVLRLVSRLARDGSLPRSVRWRLWGLLAYLAMPIDLVPDFIPVIGYADDAIIVAVVLRGVARRAGPEALARHWPGTPDGLASLERLTGMTPTG